LFDQNLKANNGSSTRWRLLVAESVADDHVEVAEIGQLLSAVVAVLANWLII
jgi:hypothetical protein